MIKRLFIVFLLVGGYHASVTATELLQWKRLPLSVTLHTGHERVIFVNRNVRVGFPAALDSKLRVQSSGGTVYLLARDGFPQTRLQLVDMDSGELILLDVSAAPGPELEPLELRYSGTVFRSDKPTRTLPEEPDTTASTPDTDILPRPVQLTRYAAQSLYAPLRTVEPVAGIMPVPVRLPAMISTLLPGEHIASTPLAAWRLEEMIVTAIKLQNLGRAVVALDPRNLQGTFLTSTFQHSWLGAKGTPEDTTVLYLVTDGEASRSLLPEPGDEMPATKNVGK